MTRLALHNQRSASNPFLQVKPSPFIRHCAHNRGASPWERASQNTVHDLELATQRKPGLIASPTFINTLLGPVLALFVVFTLLPVSWQQIAFRSVGLRFGQLGLQQVQVPLPVEYTYVSSSFGPRWGRQHQGIDLAARAGQPIYAMSDGTVIHSGWEKGYGQSVVLDHGQGLTTRYAHCSKLLVPVGRTVTKGQAIAKVGSSGHSTGPHLHFEVLVKGIRKNPAWYFPFQEKPFRYWLTAKS